MGSRDCVALQAVKGKRKEKGCLVPEKELNEIILHTRNVIRGEGRLTQLWRSWPGHEFGEHYGLYIMSEAAAARWDRRREKIVDPVSSRQ